MLRAVGRLDCAGARWPTCRASSLARSTGQVGRGRHNRARARALSLRDGRHARGGAVLGGEARAACPSRRRVAHHGSRPTERRVHVANRS
eukprot:6179343-Pleurochrysis_carterae.AAC.2